MKELEAGMLAVARGEIPAPADAASPTAESKRLDRRAGLTAELPEEWIEAVSRAKVPDAFAHLDGEME